MAKRDKGKLYYEVTREKPYGFFQMLMVGGSAGSAFGFLISALVGAYEGMEMDGLVLALLGSALLGFFFGCVLTWLFIRYFDKFADPLLGTGEPKASAEKMEEAAPIPEETSVMEGEEAKGKSVDFVFPELSPDKQ